jgi:hypothetical protein
MHESVNRFKNPDSWTLTSHISRQAPAPTLNVKSSSRVLALPLDPRYENEGQRV